MIKNKLPAALDELLTEFDEADYTPTNFCDNTEREAKIWKENLMYEIDLILDEKTAIERRGGRDVCGKVKRRRGELFT